MNTGLLDPASVVTLSQGALRKPAPSAQLAQARTAAQSFEAQVISLMAQFMFEGVETDGPFGGGQGEQVFRSLLIEQYGKLVAARGGIGLSDRVTRELLQGQEIGQ